MSANSPQDAVERALAAARCDDCVVIADETSSANLRWAGNTLTTNGVSRSRQLTVIAVSRSADGARVGVVSRAGRRADDQIAEIVAEAEQAAAEGSPGRGRQPLLGTDRRCGGEPRPQRAGTTSRASTQIGVFSGFAGDLGGAFDTAARRRAQALRVRRARR